jgi:hypothetical protein
MNIRAPRFSLLGSIIAFLAMAWQWCVAWLDLLRGKHWEE